MGKEIGKIIRGESHILYWTQVHNHKEVTPPLLPEDSAYGSFVLIEKTLNQNGKKIPWRIIGVICDTMLLDRDALRTGPKLAQDMDTMRSLFPDFIDERIKVVKILIIGQIKNGIPIHNFPLISPDLGDSVMIMDDRDIIKFHTINNNLQLGYYSLVIEYSTRLMRRILDQIQKLFSTQGEIAQLLINNLEYMLKMKRSWI